jgi:GcrA cell cycle regulator
LFFNFAQLWFLDLCRRTRSVHLGVVVNFEWTKKMETAVISMRCNGQSATQIAKKLGGGVTRNAVLGKIYRLREAGHLIPTQTSGASPRVRIKPPAPPKAAPAPQVVAHIHINAAHYLSLTMMDLQPNQCRWPLNDPADEEFLFCGNHRLSGKPYCDEHCAAAYTQSRGTKDA